MAASDARDGQFYILPTAKVVRFWTSQTTTPLGSLSGTSLLPGEIKSGDTLEGRSTTPGVDQPFNRCFFSSLSSFSFLPSTPNSSMTTKAVELPH